MKQVSRIPLILSLILLICSNSISSHPFFRSLETTTTTDSGTETETTTTTSASSEITITGSQSNYETIPNIIISIEAIAATYNLIFDNLPQDSTGKDTSTLDDIQSGLETYKKVRNFVVVMTTRREELLKDLNFIKDNVGEMGLSKYEVLGFYDLRSSYEQLIRKFKAYEPGFQAKDAYMDAEVKEFQEDITEIVKALDVIMAAETIVWTKTEFIRTQIDESDTSTAVLSSIDATLLLMLELLEYRKNVISQLDVARPRILDLSYKRERFIQILTDQMLYIGFKTTTDQTTNVGRKIAGVMLILWMWVM